MQSSCVAWPHGPKSAMQICWSLYRHSTWPAAQVSGRASLPLIRLPRRAIILKFEVSRIPHYLQFRQAEAMTDQVASKRQGYIRAVYVKNAWKATSYASSSVTRRHCRPMKRPCAWTHVISMPGTAKERLFTTRAIIRRPWKPTNGQPRLTRITLLYGSALDSF